MLSNFWGGMIMNMNEIRYFGSFKDHIQNHIELKWAIGYKYNAEECPYRHHIMPVIFRMIYICGLRPSEARLLKVADVDLENDILTINHSKKDNSRLVPMSDLLAECCRSFSQGIPILSQKITTAQLSVVNL